MYSNDSKSIRTFANINWFIFFYFPSFHVTTCHFIQSTTQRNTRNGNCCKCCDVWNVIHFLFLIKFLDKIDIYVLYIHQNFKAHAMLRLSFDWMQIGLHDLFRVFIYDKDTEDNYSFAFNVICLLHVNLMNYL